VGALIVVALVEESLRQHGDVEGLQVTFDREHAPKRGVRAVHRAQHGI
jgi:hypothetical protein